MHCTKQKSLEKFQCPHCESTKTTLPYNAEEGACPNCGNHIYITDMLGFHLDMAEDAASNSVAMAYMSIHETLLLFTGIRFFWENNKETLRRCLFFKDGPLHTKVESFLASTYYQLMLY